MKIIIIVLFLTACSGALHDGAPRQVARVYACEVACSEALRPPVMSVVRGRECRCWAPLLPGEIARPATARIVLP